MKNEKHQCQVQYPQKRKDPTSIHLLLCLFGFLLVSRVWFSSLSLWGSLCEVSQTGNRFLQQIELLSHIAFISLRHDVKLFALDFFGRLKVKSYKYQ